MSGSVVSPVFIGRKAEMTALARLTERARAGDTAFALIGGEAGIGKTRLVREFGERSAALGFVVLTGQCVELGGEGLPLAPLVDALRALVKATAPDVLADVLGPAAEGLARLLPELAPGTAVGPAAEELQKARTLRRGRPRSQERPSQHRRHGGRPVHAAGPVPDGDDRTGRGRLGGGTRGRHRCP